MRVVAKILLLFSSLAFLLSSSAAAGQPCCSTPRFVAPGHLATSINRIRRHRGIGYHSSGYHYMCPGCLPHEDWHPYQNLKYLQAEINPEIKGQVSPSDIIREGKRPVQPLKFNPR